jgi:hypothetical protein
MKTVSSDLGDELQARTRKELVEAAFWKAPDVIGWAEDLRGAVDDDVVDALKRSAQRWLDDAIDALADTCEAPITPAAQGELPLTP